jgi:hypothetical protein
MTALSSFISPARSKGMDHQTIRLLLLSVGWKEREIAGALASEGLSMPVPLPPDTGSARDAFLHLLTFAGLYATVINMVILLFEFIRRALPDPALGETVSTMRDVSSIRMSLAVIIIAFPLFIFLSRLLHREAVSHPEKLESGVRKWLTYLTLFVTACAIVGDTITLLFYLLNGELSLRFILKVFAVLLLSGIPFLYYFSVLRMQAAVYAAATIHRTYLRMSVLVVAVVLVWGFVLAGSPFHGRMERFDEQRINDLRVIQDEILNIIYGPERYTPELRQRIVATIVLPKDLEYVANNVVRQKVRIVDPATGTPYSYHTSGTHFSLCATFDLERDNPYDVFWNHPAGEKCFEFDAKDWQGK